MGYYVQKYSTVLKGPVALAMKSRFDARREVALTRDAHELIVERLPEKIKNEHRVTKGLQLEDKAIEKLRAAAEKAHHVALNTAMEEQHVLRAVQEIMTAVSELIVLVKSDPAAERAIEQLLEIIDKAMVKAIKDDRAVYKNVLGILQELRTNRQLDHNALMARVRTFFKTRDPSLFARMAMRVDIRRQLKRYKDLVQLGTRMKKLVAKIKTRKSKHPIESRFIVLEIETIAKKSKTDLHDAFYAAYLVLKRDFLILLNILMDADYLELENTLWMAHNLLPKAPTVERIRKVQSFKDDLAKEIHAIAQAMNILVGAEQKIEQQARRLRKVG